MQYLQNLQEGEKSKIQLKWGGQTSLCLSRVKGQGREVIKGKKILEKVRDFPREGE